MSSDAHFFHTVGTLSAQKSPTQTMVKAILNMPYPNRQTRISQVFRHHQSPQDIFPTALISVRLPLNSL